MQLTSSDLKLLLVGNPEKGIDPIPGLRETNIEDRRQLNLQIVTETQQLKNRKAPSQKIAALEARTQYLIERYAAWRTARFSTDFTLLVEAAEKLLDAVYEKESEKQTLAQLFAESILELSTVETDKKIIKRLESAYQAMVHKA